ncbi:DNA-binding protein [Bacillus sp. M6-12]|nr:DNA-binding protein [Bacillus sp. M6-12]
MEHNRKFTLHEILTATEASLLWGFERSAVRKAIERGKFEEGEYRKSEGTWLVTYHAMERVFGKIKEEQQ